MTAIVEGLRCAATYDIEYVPGARYLVKKLEVSDYERIHLARSVTGGWTTLGLRVGDELTCAGWGPLEGPGFEYGIGWLDDRLGLCVIRPGMFTKAQHIRPIPGCLERVP